MTAVTSQAQTVDQSVDPASRRPALRAGAFGHATALSCRECGHRIDLGPHYACPECFGPLEIAYDFPAVSASDIEAGPRNIWRYKALLPVPVGHRGEPQHGAGLHPPAQGQQPRPRARHRAPVGQGRLHQPHQLLQGPRGRLRPERRPRVPQQGLRLPLDRQPRQRRRRRGSPRRDQDRRLHPEQPRAAQAGQLGRLHRLAGRRERQLRRRQPARLRDRRRGGRLGVRQRQRPAVLRRGLQDSRVRDRRAARLAPARPDRDPGGVRVPADQGPQGVPGAHRPSASSRTSPTRSTAPRRPAARRCRWPTRGSTR